LAERAGLVPVTAADVIAPGENYTAKIDAIMRRSVAAVVDVTTQNTVLEFAMLMGMQRPPQTLVIVAEGTALPIDLQREQVLVRQDRPIADQPHFLESMAAWFYKIAAAIQPRLAEEPLRLLGAKEYRAAVISAITHLESLLRRALERDEPLPGRAYSLGSLVELAGRRQLLPEPDIHRIREWMRTRNMVVHSEDGVTRARATEIVRGVLDIQERLAANR